MNRLIACAVLVLLPGCMRESAPTLGGSESKELAAFAAPAAPPPEPMMEEEAAAGGGGYAERKKMQKPMRPRTLQAIVGAADAEKDGADERLVDALGGEGAASAAPAAPTRAWFPETFLFEPVVATDAAGKAEVSVRVPDRLTNWRVLALAHSREGAQAGAVASFRGTLPAYVDPILPGFLLAGDEVRLPIQVVNTTERELTQTLAVEAANAKLTFPAASVRVPAGGSAVVYATLKADRPGPVALRATLGSTDAVVRTFPVQPAGRLVELRRGGTLASPREIELEGPANLEPESAQARLTVYPGALAVLRSELAAALSREGVADDAYALLLAGRAAKLLGDLGGEADPQALRNLGIVAGQRALRGGRSPSVEQASLLAEAALAHPDNPVLARLGERMAQTVAQAQRPDGTISGATGWTLQRLLVATADGVGAVRAASATGTAARQRATGVAIRASGAFERNLDAVQDGYTAAAILASGAAQGSLAEKLRTRVREAVTQNADGSRELKLEPGVVRADGAAPSRVEAAALAVLALEGDAGAPWRADLGATVLAAYSPSWGWGDGRTNLHALRAVLALFKEPLPPRVKVSLALDGKPLREGEFDAAQLKDVLTLEAPAGEASGKHVWSVRAEPAVPGLGFALALRTYVPWEKEEPRQGLELAFHPPAELKVGRGAEVALEASAPSGVPLRLRHALPAGVQPDRPSLERLVAEGTIEGFRTEDGAVTLEIAPREPGQVFQARYRVVPTLAGTLRSAASSLEIADRPELAFFVPPATWSVK